MNTVNTSQHTPYPVYTQQIQLINETKRTYKSHDHLFKRLIETFFSEFIEAFFPEVYKEVDFSSLKFLSEEIIPDLHDEDESRLDIVVEVTDKSTDTPIVIHIEPQSYYQNDFNKRMFHYFNRLHRKLNKPVIPIAVFSYDESWNKNEYVVTAINKQFCYMFYYTLHLRSLNWRDYIHKENPVIAAFLSKMNYSENEKINVNIEFLRMLTLLDITREHRDILIDFFQSYLILNKEEEDMLMKSVEKQPDADKILEVTNPFVEYGKRRGREEGREQEQINIAYKMLAKGYTDEQISDITGLSRNQIEQIKRNNK